MAIAANPTAAWTMLSVGSYAVTGERLTVIAPSNGQTSGTIPVLFAHGYLGDATGIRNGDLYRALAEIASRGYTVLAADYGGTTTWGNDTSITTFDQVLNYAVTGLGVRSDRIVLGGEGMGSVTALNVAWRNTNRVAAIWLRAPIPNLDDFRNGNAAYTTPIWAAHGGGITYFGALPAHDPVLNVAKLSGIGPLIRLDWTQVDPLVPPEWIYQFLSDVGAEAFMSRDGAFAIEDPLAVADWIDQRVRTVTPTPAPRVNPARSLERIGISIDQMTARTERERWLALVRNAGSAAPSPSTLHYTTGDVTDGWKGSANTTTWTLADYTANTAGISALDTDDTFTSTFTAFPTRNGALVTDTAGVFNGQLYRSGTTGIWLDANLDGGFPAGHLWWPLTVIQNPADNIYYLGAWYVDGNTAGSTTHFGTILDSHIIRLNAFLGFAAKTPLNLGANAEKFAIECIRFDDTYMYILGGEFVPTFNTPLAGGAPSYAVGDLATLRGQTDFLFRIARVPHAQLETIANWQYWNGITWVSGFTNAALLVDTAGNPINGSSGIARIGTDHWALAAHQMVDSHVDVYNAAGPQGPWQQIARVPVYNCGTTANKCSTFNWHTKIIEPGTIPAPANHRVVMLTSGMTPPPGGTADPKDLQNIRRWTPQFVTVPV